jgi:hypothetical protein
VSEVDADARLAALSDLYRKTDGNMRTCNRNASIICNERQCYLHGCARANNILQGRADDVK